MIKFWAVVVAQLAERLHPTQEVCSLYPVIIKIYIKLLFTVNCKELLMIKYRT